VKVGDENALTTTTTAPRSGATSSTYGTQPARTAAATTAPAATAPPRTAPARGDRTVADVDGFRLSLGVGTDGATEFPAADRLELTLRVENLAPETRQYDTNERRNFEMTTVGTNEVVWDDNRCAPRPDPYITATVDLAHGESVGYADAYKGGSCALPPGRYKVVGVFTWCPPGSVPEGKGTCYPDRVATVRSLPVEVTFTP
jgi:hypothetical protein